MKKRNKRVLALLLTTLLLSIMIVPASAANSVEELNVASFTSDEIAFFETQGIDFSKVVDVSYTSATITSSSVTGRSTEDETVDVLQFSMKDGDQSVLAAMVFLDDAGAPTSARNMVNLGLIQTAMAYGQSGTRAFTAYAYNKVQTNYFDVTWINPFSFYVSSNSSLYQMRADYSVYGNRVNTTTGAVLEYDYSTGFFLNRFSVVPNEVYHAGGAYLLPTNEAVETTPSALYSAVSIFLEYKVNSTDNFTRVSLAFEPNI